ncbi:hypothetical protein CGGC5_v013875 [Colletotrichum fructicola Nara gc5]|uniref:Uncharacterized protein n=1 Tax=Colletotrichum fructicola (strain Nara gc5) TaxID=1213859 RepID=A0A7J6IRM4_COLFN|nr:hypothetical protein CGGC5_v013875 [Colletotrichum fructicola Nara gc5]
MDGSDARISLRAVRENGGEPDVVSQNAGWSITSAEERVWNGLYLLSSFPPLLHIRSRLGKFSAPSWLSFIYDNRYHVQRACPVLCGGAEEESWLACPLSGVFDATSGQGSSDRPYG